MEPPSKRPKRNAGALSSTRMFNTDSPITKAAADIQTFISLCLLKWYDYTEDEKISIVCSLPIQYQIFTYDAEGKLNCPVTPDFIANDITIRDQVARFKRDVTEGFYTKTWQEKARRAMQERAMGKFDDYLQKHADELFCEDDDIERSNGREGSRKDGLDITQRNKDNRNIGGEVSDSPVQNTLNHIRNEEPQADEKEDKLRI